MDTKWTNVRNWQMAVAGNAFEMLIHSSMTWSMSGWRSWMLMEMETSLGTSMIPSSSVRTAGTARKLATLQ